MLGRALPLLNNPLVVAEEFAMLDNITGGRLVAGFVRGIGAEYHSWGANPAESHDRFHEAHDLILQAWTQPGPFDVRGQVLSLRIRELLAAAVSAAASAGLDSLAGLARDDRMGLASRPQIHLSADLQPGDGAGALHEHVSRDREAIRLRGDVRAGRLGGPDLLRRDRRDRDRARREPHIEFFFNKLLRMPPEMLLPPGYLSLASMQGVMQAKRALSTGNQTIEDMMEKGVFLCGSPATLREKLEKYQAEIGFGYLLPAMQFGTLPHELVRKSVEMFAKEVIPHFRARGRSAAQSRALRLEPPAARRTPMRRTGLSAYSASARERRRWRRSSGRSAASPSCSRSRQASRRGCRPGRLAASHSPIISESTRAGARRETSASPTGARCSSPIVTTMK